MKLNDFIEQFNQAPIEEEEFAQKILEIENCPDLLNAANYYLASLGKFRDVLADYELEIG